MAKVLGLLLFSAVLSTMIARGCTRPQNGQQTRCSSAQEPTMKELLNHEKRRLTDRMGRVARLDYGAGLPSPPTMVSKLAKKLGKRSITGVHDGTAEHAEATYVIGRLISSGSTSTRSCLTSTTVGACIEFPLNETITPQDVLQRVSLWMHYEKPSRFSPDSNGTVEIFEIIRTSRGHTDVREELIATFPALTTVDTGYIEVDVTKMFQGQPGLLQRVRVLRVQWREHMGSAKPPISVNDSFEKPFLEIKVKKTQRDIDGSSQVQHVESGRRGRRHATDVNTPHQHHCSLRHFYVNFTDFEWNSWIIAPTGYKAGYCAGACSHRSGGGVLNGLLRDRLSATPPCCAPIRRMHPLQIVYADRSKGDENIVYRTVLLPNMTLTDCACR